MLRITTATTKEGMAIKLEGRLVGRLVDEAERTWHTVSADGLLKPVLVDLCGVTFIDAEGKKLLRHMCGAGAAFRCCGPDITATIEEIEREHASMNRRPGSASG
jgi:anti-anti-sigma regulatory factor